MTRNIEIVTEYVYCDDIIGWSATHSEVVARCDERFGSGRWVAVWAGHSGLWVEVSR